MSDQYSSGELFTADPNGNGKSLVTKSDQVPQNESELQQLAGDLAAQDEAMNNEVIAGLEDDPESMQALYDHCTNNPPESMEYVVRGANLRCNYGSHNRKLNLPKDHAVYITQAPMVHKLDCIPGDMFNIAAFGVCNAPAAKAVNPQPAKILLVKQDYDEEGNPIAGASGNVKGLPCLPLLAAPWFETYDDTRIVDNGDKDPSDKKKDNDDPGKGYAAVTTSSFLVCLMGGIIAPVNSGQNKQEMEQEITTPNSTAAAAAETEPEPEPMPVPASELEAEEGAGGNDKADLFISNEYLSLEEMKVNARYIRDQLNDMGWSENAIIACLANWEAECSINPGKWQGKENNKNLGFGLAQWTPASKYFDWAEEKGLNPYDIDTQLQCIQAEVEGEMPDWYSWQDFRHEANISFEEFTKSEDRTAEDLAEIYMLCHERPRDKSKVAIDKRKERTEKWKNLD